MRCRRALAVGFPVTHRPTKCLLSCLHIHTYTHTQRERERERERERDPSHKALTVTWVSHERRRTYLCISILLSVLEVNKAVCM